MVSAGAVGATSMFSSLSGVAPTLVRRLYDICRTEKYFDARPAQEDLAALRQIVKRAGAGGLKGALRAMGRECGQPRPPLDALSAGGYDKLATSRILFEERFGLDLDRSNREFVFVGDSQNDAPMFAFFRNSVGVANVRRFEGRLAASPKYVTGAASGAGFVELVEHLLQSER